MSQQEGQHLVCAGAICQCQFGKAPAKFKVLTHTKHYINDEEGKEKLVATHKEIGQPFQPPFFGSCSKANNGPCAVNVTGWSNYYEKITYAINGNGMPLLEGSKGTCSIGATDCISIAWHGQSATPSAQNIHQVDTNAATQINPLVNIKELKKTYTNNDIYINTIDGRVWGKLGDGSGDIRMIAKADWLNANDLTDEAEKINSLYSNSKVVTVDDDQIQQKLEEVHTLTNKNNVEHQIFIVLDRETAKNKAVIGPTGVDGRTEIQSGLSLEPNSKPTIKVDGIHYALFG